MNPRFLLIATILGLALADIEIGNYAKPKKLGE